MCDWRGICTLMLNARWRLRCGLVLSGLAWQVKVLWVRVEEEEEEEEEREREHCRREIGTEITFGEGSR